MQLYIIAKHLHVWFAVLTFAGLSLRFVWLCRNHALLRHPLVRVLPHINDTGLLVTGAIMAWLLRYSPHQHPWFAAKLCLILLYILLGFVLFKSRLANLYKYFIFSASFITYASIIFLVLHKPY